MIEPRLILKGSEAREKLLNGARILSEIVGTTLGPAGRNVTLSSKYAGTITVHDGITVSKEIVLLDSQENVGAHILKEAANKTNDVSGDGTTTATVLAYEILKEGNTYITTGVNPMMLVKGIEKATKEAVNLLKGMAESIKDDVEKIVQIATVSAADSEIGKVVSEALIKVGSYGVVTADKGSEMGYVTEYKDGMEWDKGWNLPYFVTNPQKMEAVLNDPYILVTDRTITQASEVLPILNLIIGQENKTVVIISDGMEQQAQSILLENHVNIMRPNGQRGSIISLAVGAPSTGEHKRDGLEDIAIITGATFISKELGRTLKDFTLEDFGHADQVVATRESTVIVGGKGDYETVKERITQVEQQLKEQEHEYLKEKYEERLAKLTSGVAVIKIGTASDTENREKLERIKDAIGATKAAVEDGIIPGGGLALFRIGESLKIKEALSRDESYGVDIVKKAIQKPLKLLAENAGANGEVVANETRKQKNENVGFNVLTGEYMDLKKAGIIDPVRVTISALQNAASVASMVLTTEGLVVEKPKREKEE